MMCGGVVERVCVDGNDRWYESWIDLVREARVKDANLSALQSTIGSVRLLSIIIQSPIFQLVSYCIGFAPIVD